MLLEMTTGTWVLLGAVFLLAFILFIADAASKENQEKVKKSFAPIVTIILIIGAIWAIIEASN
jgi:H+/gluconate symporter-like permease